jgi:dehydrogenase/reductase SDR family protein 1
MDILVNNVWSGYENIYQANSPKEYIFENNFWELPTNFWDDIFKVGLRSHFLASQQAVPLMIGQKNALI